MAFTSHDAEVVLRVLVTVFHFNPIASELSFMCLGDVSVVLLSRIAGFRRVTGYLALQRDSSHSSVHRLSFFRARRGPDATCEKLKRGCLRKGGASPFGNSGTRAPHDAPNAYVVHRLPSLKPRL
jgi:hypothetical protein